MLWFLDQHILVANFGGHGAISWIIQRNQSRQVAPTVACQSDQTGPYAGSPASPLHFFVGCACVLVIRHLVVLLL